jgi:hypothetical protein
VCNPLPTALDPWESWHDNCVVSSPNSLAIDDDGYIYIGWSYLNWTDIEYANVSANQTNVITRITGYNEYYDDVRIYEVMSNSSWYTNPGRTMLGMDYDEQSGLIWFYESWYDTVSEDNIGYKFTSIDLTGDVVYSFTVDWLMSGVGNLSGSLAMHTFGIGTEVLITHTTLGESILSFNIQNADYRGLMCTANDPFKCMYAYVFDNGYGTYPALAYSSEKDRIYVLDVNYTVNTDHVQEFMICEYNIYDMHPYFLGCFNIDPPLQEYVGFDYKDGIFYLLDASNYYAGEWIDTTPDVYLSQIVDPFLCEAECHEGGSQCTKDGSAFYDCFEEYPDCWKYYRVGESWNDGNKNRDLYYHECSSGTYCEEYWANHKIKKTRCVDYTHLENCTQGERTCAGDNAWSGCVVRQYNSRGDTKWTWNSFTDPQGFYGSDYGYCQHGYSCSDGWCTLQDTCEDGESRCVAVDGESYMEACSEYDSGNGTVWIFNDWNRTYCEYGCVAINLTGGMRVTQCMNTDVQITNVKSSFNEISNWIQKDIPSGNPLISYGIGFIFLMVVIIAVRLYTRESESSFLSTFVVVIVLVFESLVGLMPFWLLYVVLLVSGFYVFRMVRGGDTDG